MRIERRGGGVNVEDIQVGECFLLDGDVCLRVRPCVFSDVIEEKIFVYYMDLEDGFTIERLTPEYRVKPLRAKIVIE